ncbi:MAG TPA: DUF255 domain-containing protein [Fimbriimonadales bacterium]|nr:DUF255 domain-containing protein [Fimbriimonadales bacterium]
MRAHSKSPRFTVVTNLLVIIVLFGIGIRLASKYLPERQPNRLAIEYGAYVRSGSHHQVNWYAFSPEPFEIAKKNNMLIFLEIGSTLSSSSLSLTKNAFEDGDVIRLLNSHYVSIRVDINEFPAIALAVSLNTPLLYSSENSLILVLTPDGKIVDEKFLRPFPRETTRDAFIDFLQNYAREWAHNPDSLRKQAASIEKARAMRVYTNAKPGFLERSIAEFYLDALLKHVDVSTIESQTHALPIRAEVPELLFESHDERALQNLKVWLLRLCSSAVYDPIRGGFFHFAYEPGWRQPRFAKSTSSSLLLASIYAQAGSVFDAPLFRWIAKQTMDWALDFMLDSETGLFCAGIATDEDFQEKISVYEWESESLTGIAGEVFEIEGNAAVGAIRLKGIREYNAAVSREQVERIQRAILQLRSKIASIRLPEKDEGVYSDINGKSIASLFIIASTLKDEEAVKKTKEIYHRAMQVFVQPIGDVVHAPEGRARIASYLGSYVWMARAAIECYRATGDDSALNDAKRITDRMLELFEHPGGGFITSLPSAFDFAPFVMENRNIVDEFDESLNALAARNLLDLRMLTNSERYSKAALATLSAFAGSAPRLGIWTAGYMRAVFEYFEQ